MDQEVDLKVRTDKALVYYVYVHKRPTDGSVFYVGKGTARRAWTRSSRNPHWQHIVDKHGGFDVEIVKSGMTENEALDYESLIVRQYGMENLANMVEGGSGITGYTHTEECKQRMSESHKQRNIERPEELERKRETLRAIHKRRAENPEDYVCITEGAKNWWKQLSEKELEEISKVRSENSKKMWADPKKKEEIRQALCLAFQNVDEKVKRERIEKSRTGLIAYYDNITDEQREELARRADLYLRSESAIKRYKEVRCLKLVLDRRYLVESRAEFSRLLGVSLGGNVPTREKPDGRLVRGFFVEVYNPDMHKDIEEISSLEGISRKFPVSNNSRPVKNSDGFVFLSLQEAAESIKNSNGSALTRQTSITSACTEKVRAYGKYWSKPTVEEVEKEVFRRLGERFNE